MPKALLLLFLSALACALLLGCGGPESLSDPTLGALTISFEAPVEKSTDGARAITGNYAVQVKLTSEEYPPILKSGSFPGSVTVDGVKAGTWLAQVYLNDASGATQYYGESSVVVQPGAITDATIRVYAMGSVAIGISEGVVAPTFTPGTANTTAGTVAVTISLPSYLTGAIIRYTTTGTDPTATTGTMVDSGNSVTVSLTGVLKAITVMTADNATSPVAVYSYSLPLIAVSQGATAIASGGTYTFDMVPPGNSGTPVYVTIKNNGTGADLQLTGVKVELTGTASDKFDYDLADLQTVIGAGQSTRFSLTFSPPATETYTATLKIYSNSGVDSPFSCTLSGTGNNAPTLSFLTGLDVQGAGNSSTNGFYQYFQVGDGGYSIYKHQDASYYIFYESHSTNGNPYYNRYLLGDATAADGYDYQTGTSGHTRMYVKNYGQMYNPVGEKFWGDGYDDQWYSPYSYGFAPYVSTIDGIGGWARSTLTLTAYYQYQDDESNTEGTTTFQWYRADDSSGPWTAISGQISQTYVLTPSDTGKYISVGVTPVASDGASPGTMQRSTGLLINQ